MTSADPAHGLRSKRILLTGAAGFIGFHLVLRLTGSGAEVHGLDNLNAYYDVALKQARLSELRGVAGFSFREADLVDHAAIRKCFDELRPDVVIHLAAQAGVRYSLTTPRAYTSANIDGFLSILEACRAFPVSHLMYASSSSVYGSNTELPYREDDRVDQPVSLYAATKRANELMAHTYAHLYGIRASGLRFFTVYGPWGRPDMAYYKFTEAVLNDEPIDVYNHGRMRRDLTYIDDVTEALARLVNVVPSSTQAGCAVPPHVVYNIGNHAPVELKHLISVVEHAVGRKAKLRLLPMQPGDVLETYADVSRLAAATGFSPSTTIETGIGRFVAWYRDYHRDDLQLRKAATNG